MRKSIIAQALCAVLGVTLLFTPLGAFAAEKTVETQGDVLTYADATARGVRKSVDYQSAELGQEQATEANKDLVVYYDTYIPVLWQAKDEAKLAEKWSAKALQMARESVANSIRNQMDSISLQLLEKKNLEEQIVLKKEALRIAQAKYEGGIISNLELSVAKMDLQTAEQDKLVLEKKLEGGYIALYGALDLPVDTTRPLEYAVEYEVLGPVDLDRKYTEALESDPYVWQKEELIKTAQYKLDSYQYNAGGKNYALTKLDVTQSKLKEQTTKRNLKVAIETRYNSLKQSEEGLKSLELKEEQAKLALESAELKYKAGMAIALDVQQARQTLSNLQFEKTKVKQTYAQMKVIFDTLYLNPDYVVH